MAELFYDGPNAGMEDPLMQAAMRFDALMTQRILAPAHVGTEEDVALVKETFDKYKRKEHESSVGPSSICAISKPVNHRLLSMDG
jgi:hypothetical protein